MVAHTRGSSRHVAVRNLAHLAPLYELAKSLSTIGDADEIWEISDAPASLDSKDRKGHCQSK